MSIRRRRPEPGAVSWSAIATPTRCAAPRIFPRPRRGKSAAGATDFPAWPHSLPCLASGKRAKVPRSAERRRGVIDVSAFDRQHPGLGGDAAIGGEAAGLAAGGEHAVARHHDRTGIAPERLADVARQFDAAEPFCNIAIGHGFARRDAARDVVDAAVEFGNVVEIEHDIPEIVGLTREQFDDPVDCALHLTRRRRLRDFAMALPDAGASPVFIGHRQLHRIDPAFPPNDAAAADRGVEYCKMVAGHGWLQILLSPAVNLMLAWNLGLEIVAIHPNSGEFCAVPKEPGRAGDFPLSARRPGAGW